MKRYTKEEIRENRLKWIRALESGRYKQTRGQLRRDLGSTAGQCCLGVACTVSRVGKWVDLETGLPQYLAENPKPAYPGDGLESQGLTLPRAVQKWLGIRGDDPWFGSRKASTLNDGAQLSFKEIAAHARRQWGLVNV